MFCFEFNQILHDKNIAKGNLNKIKNTYKLTSIRCFFALCLIVLMTFCSCSSSSASDNSYIDVIKNGYLGEFDDVTVDEMLTNYLSVFYDSLTWDVGTTNDNKVIVQLHASAVDKELKFDDTDIQFTFLDNDVFQVSGLKDGTLLTEDTKASDVAYFMDAVYLNYYMKKINPDENAYSERLNSINATSCLYGASASYDGDRKKLYELFEDKPMDMTAFGLINYYLGLNPEGTSFQAEDTQEEAIADNNDIMVDAVEDSDNGYENTETVSDVVSTLSNISGAFTGGWGNEIHVEAYTDKKYVPYSGDPIGYLSVYGYDEGYLYNAEDFSGYDLGKGYFICEGTEETIIMEVSDNGDGGYYVAIYHDDDEMHMIDDFVCYPFS